MAKKPPKPPKGKGNVLDFPPKKTDVAITLEEFKKEYEAQSTKGKKNKPQARTEGQKLPVPGEMPVKRPVGRPSSFSPELGQTICERYSHGESITALCRDPDMPNLTTVYRWRDAGEQAAEGSDLHNFAKAMMRAQERYADSLVSQIQEIADDGTNDWMEKETQRGSYVALNSEHVQRSKLRVETRLKVAAMLNPKKYAAMTKHADADGNKLPAAEVNDLDLARRIAFILERAKGKVG